MRWSNSALFTLQQCGERFRRRYIERDFRPTGVKAKRGTAVHKVASEAHMRQMAAKEAGVDGYVSVLPTVEEAKDVAADAFNRAVEEGVAFTEDELCVGKDRVLGQEKDVSVQMGEHYVGVVAPRVDPIGVERRVTIRPQGTDIEITGIVDLVSQEWAPLLESTPELLNEDQSGLLGQRRVRFDGGRVEVINDLKTSDRQPYENAVEKSQQLALYALIRTAETGRIPDRVRLRTLVRTRTGKVSHVEQTGTKTEADLEAVAQRLNTAIATFEAGVFMPANPDSWWCSEKFCEYWTDCRYSLGRGQR